MSLEPHQLVSASSYYCDLEIIFHFETRGVLKFKKIFQKTGPWLKTQSHPPDGFFVVLSTTWYFYSQVDITRRWETGLHRFSKYLMDECST